MKLLIAGPDTFAKVVCSTLLVRCLKQQLPEVQIHYQIKEQLQDALVANPYIDVLETEISTWQEAENVDCVIDLTASKEWKGVAAKKDYAYISSKGSLLQRLGIDIGRQKPHLAMQYLSAAKSLMVRDDGRGLNYFIPPAGRIAAQDIPTAHSAGYIILVLDEASLKEHFMLLLQAFCRQMQHPFILIGGQREAAWAAGLSAIDPVKIYAACGKFTRNETADLIQYARLVVTPETAWMQVAAAFNKPVVALSGTAKSSLWFPPFYGQQFLKQQHQLPYALINSAVAQKAVPVRAGQLVQAVQQLLLNKQ